MKSKFRFLLSLFLVLVILLNTFPQENIKKVCILYSPSKYKEKLLEKVEVSLKGTNVFIEKDTFKNIEKYNPKDYDAILLLSGIAAFIPYPKATKYIKKNNYSSNIVYFCATYLEKEDVYGFLDKNKIDAITAASEEENIDETAKKIVDEIYKIILESNK